MKFFFHLCICHNLIGRNEEEWAKETAQDSNEKFLAMLSLMKDFSGLDGGINANEDNANRNEVIESIIKDFQRNFWNCINSTSNFWNDLQYDARISKIGYIKK